LTFTGLIVELHFVSREAHEVEFRDETGI